MLTNSQTVRIDRHELPPDPENLPDGLTALTFADPAQATDAASLPLVFVLHGLGSRKERHLDLCLRLADAGFLACMIDARFHGDRRITGAPENAALEGEKRTPEFVKTFWKTIQGTMVDIQMLTRYFGRERYGLIGHSMGGFIATHLALVDTLAKPVALVNVSGSIDFRPPPGFVLPLGGGLLLAMIDAAARADKLWPTATLLIHGDGDKTVPLAGATRLYENALSAYAEDPSRLRLDVLPGVGHDWTPEMAEKAVEWMIRFKGEIVGPRN